jgi:hypothetical protein
MRTYKIYRKDAEVVAVKDGFSYPGFFFTWIWALVKRLWTVGLFFFLLNAFAFSIFEWISHKNFHAADHLSAGWVALNLSTWVVKAFLGYYGNTLVSKKLLRLGYVQVPGTVRAANIHMATVIGLSPPAELQNNPLAHRWLQSDHRWIRWIGGTVLVLLALSIYLFPLPYSSTPPAIHRGALQQHSNPFSADHFVRVLS